MHPEPASHGRQGERFLPFLSLMPNPLQAAVGSLQNRQDLLMATPA